MTISRRARRATAPVVLLLACLIVSFLSGVNHARAQSYHYDPAHGRTAGIWVES